eukprot:c11639_g1_i1.p1 GENE.c11639_g1_i1~~c11639_g1_i1.p1  ORF type:complete len:371 (+),score=137.28 c11639_g1_i1:126-1115(+)
MQITLKSLKGDLFHLDVEASSSVKQLKDHIQSTKEIGVDKLIHQGKILEDDKSLSSYDIADGAMIIMMVKKSAPAKKEPTPAPVQQAPAAAARAPVPAPASAPASAAAPTAQAAGIVLGPELEAIVQEMCSMGFPREQVLLAMRAAFNNPERAMQYLLDGIPENVLAPQVTTAPAAAAAGTAPAQQDVDVGDFGDDDDAGAVGGGMTVDELRQSVPGLEQALAAVRQRPEMLQPILAQLARERPDIIQAINQNQGAFLQLLAQMGDDGGDGGAGDLEQPMQLQVTPEEHASIRRLMDLGFPESAVVEAYFSCDKDETLAANYLFENFGQ